VSILRAKHVILLDIETDTEISIEEIESAVLKLKIEESHGSDGYSINISFNLKTVYCVIYTQFSIQSLIQGISLKLYCPGV